MTPMFLGGLAGDGVVTDITGKAVQSFSVEFFSQWSIGADALHLDETMIYERGRRERRSWAMQADGRGRMLGYDSGRRIRLRALAGRDKVRLVYDRPLGAGAEIAGPRTVIDLMQSGDGSVRMEGRMALLGLPYQRTRAVLHWGAATT